MRIPSRANTLFLSRLVGYCLLSIVFAAPTTEAADSDQSRVDYERDIRPIFQAHCFDCHGPDEQESGLRLDAPRFIRRGGDRGATVVSHDKDKSLLLQAIIGTDAVSRMPLDAPALSDKQIRLITRWIVEGANMPADDSSTAGDRIQSDHWSFQPIQHPTVPEVSDQSWPRNPIDQFVLNRLEQEGLSPSHAAKRTTLIRRLTLDLVGLLPSPAQVERFLADNQPGAYERLVDRLLDSPRYGERWGRHWLDVARYADSNGFTIDGSRTIWKYRDWVIDAVNRDLPFDQFTIEQLAGDLLPGPSRDQLIATGFHRNTLVNQEGGTDDEQFRVEAVVDRVNTTGAAFLGLTVGCAQCHSHKYDPISQRDFYRLYAFFNSCEDVNTMAPMLPVPTPQQTQALAHFDQQIAATQKQLKEIDRHYAPGQSSWEKQFTAATPDNTWQVLDPTEFRSAGSAYLAKLEDQSILVGGTIPDDDHYVITTDIPIETITAIRLEVLTHKTLPQNGPGLASNGNFILSGFEAKISSDSPEGEMDSTDVPIPFVSALADHSQPGWPVIDAVDNDPTTGWAINIKKGDKSAKLNADHEALFVTTRPIEVPPGNRLTITMRHRPKKYAVGRFRLSVTGVEQSLLPLSDKTQELLAIPAEKRSKQQQQQLKTAYLQSNPVRKPVAAKLERLEKQRRQLNDQIPTTLVMRDLEKPRDTFIQIRGDFLQPGAQVQPGVPSVLPQLAAKKQSANRLDLARWLVDPQNPLTARVVVNRHWQRFFGTGIVVSENDFGTQGNSPSHPELLDWLAREFMRRGWSVKSLHRLIVTSATYRQSSEFRPELQQRDPANKLLARQSRIRLEAEAVRDVCLSASGLLSEKMHGPSVFPPQPEGIYVLTQNQKNWKADKGEDRYRRGLYTFFWRSSPDPFMATFDAPNANTTCTRRTRSNTPLQALTLANDQAFVELAQGMAGRVLRDAPAYDEGRMRYAFLAGLSREPTSGEFTTLLQFLETQRSEFQKEPDIAAQIAPKNVSESPIEGAAWTAVARVLMNLDEFVTRD